ncbi:hypothetical protein PspLS_04142 [Pyricularia sp. CBS 133598]|nr:hypothetical protein PspLS_04142 [Pyricularia sp. CBS 133598]
MHNSPEAQDQKQKSLHAQQGQVTPRQRLDRPSNLSCSGPPPQEEKHRRGKYTTKVCSQSLENCFIGGSSKTQKLCFPLYFKSSEQLPLKRPRYLSLGSSPSRRNSTDDLARQRFSPRTLLVGPNSS